VAIVEIPPEEFVVGNIVEAEVALVFVKNARAEHREMKVILRTLVMVDRTVHDVSAAVAIPFEN
jgi:hypothetical protein